MSTGRRLRILAVASSYPRHSADPAGSFVRTGLLALVRRGHQVTVVHPHPGGRAEFEDDPQIARVAVRPGRTRSSLADRGGMPERLSSDPRSWFEAPLLLRAMTATMRDLAPRHDAVLSHWLVPGGWAGAAAARRTGLPHVCVLHSGGVHLLRKLPFGHLLARRIAASTDQFVGVSNFVAERFRDLVGEPAPIVETHPNPLPDACFDTPPPDGLRTSLLFLGRLVPVKGLRVLLDALRGEDELDVVIAGDGPLRNELHDEVRRRGLPVRFVGIVDGRTKARLLREAKALVVPSLELAGGRTEGAPVVIAEALAAGTPVVASSVGGIPEMVTPGVTGWLTPPGDLDALRDGILTAATHPGLDAATLRRAADRYRDDRFATFLQTLLRNPAEAAA